MKLRTTLVTLSLAALLGLAQARIGSDSELLLDNLEAHSFTLSNESESMRSFRTEDNFVFTLETRGQALYRVAGGGELDAASIIFVADLVGAATGYGAGIAEPVAQFFTENVGNLSGQGVVDIPVEQFMLGLEVSGSSAPYDISFTLGLNEISATLLPDSPHSLGAEDARFVIREFSSPQCPFCARFDLEMMPQIRDTLLSRGDVRFEYHHFPLITIHANAAPASEALECVAASDGQQAFWDFKKVMMERQRAWSSLGDPNGFFVRLADELDLDSDSVASCLEAGEFRTEVMQAYQHAGSQLGLTGTPSVLINGFRVPNPFDLAAYEQIFTLIDAFAED